MYYLLRLLALVGIKPQQLRQALRQHYANHERGHHNLSVYNRKKLKRAIGPDEEQDTRDLIHYHEEKAAGLRHRMMKLI